MNENELPNPDVPPKGRAWITVLKVIGVRLRFVAILAATFAADRLLGHDPQLLGQMDAAAGRRQRTTPGGQGILLPHAPEGRPHEPRSRTGRCPSVRSAACRCRCEPRAKRRRCRPA